MLQPGDSLDGYRIIRLIGSGGFGEVWLCQSEAVGDLRALKFIRAADTGRIEKEFDAICKYRTAAAQLRSPSIMLIEHVNRRSDGLFYVMPLADGYGAQDPGDPDWHPVTLAALIEGRKHEPAWFTPAEIKRLFCPPLHALQMLSDAGLVHRDVKPDNILVLAGVTCLGDMSLLGHDAYELTRRGTPGYSAPSWYLESGGNPDMYGAATTLYTLLTGNPPDKMGRAAFKWPPQGEPSFSAENKQEWARLHEIVKRAVDDRPGERFRDFSQFCAAVENEQASAPSGSSGTAARLFAGAGIAALVLSIGLWSWLSSKRANTPPPEISSSATTARHSTAQLPRIANLSSVPELYRPRVLEFQTALEDARKKLTYSRSDFSRRMDEIVATLEKVNRRPVKSETYEEMKSAEARFLALLNSTPAKPNVSARTQEIQGLRQLAKSGGESATPAQDDGLFDREILPLMNEQVDALALEVSTEGEFRLEQMKRVMPLARQTGSDEIYFAAQKFAF